jgi:hypothetical protein
VRACPPALRRVAGRWRLLRRAGVHWHSLGGCGVRAAGRERDAAGRSGTIRGRGRRAEGRPGTRGLRQWERSSPPKSLKHGGRSGEEVIAVVLGRVKHDIRRCADVQADTIVRKETQ